MDHDDHRNPLPQLDLHRLTREPALRRLSQELHAARVRGAPALVVITGKGHGNRTQEPILRRIVEDWLDGPSGRAAGVRGWKRVRREGALEVRLARPGNDGRY